MTSLSGGQEVGKEAGERLELGLLTYIELGVKIPLTSSGSPQNGGCFHAQFYVFE